MSNAWKVTVFGAGGTGGAIADLLTQKQYGEVVLIDVQKDMAEGKAMDIEQSGALMGSDTKVVGGIDPILSKDSNVVIITAGIGRKPGLRREDLIATNARVMKEISQSIRMLSPDAFVIVLTNPADILTRVVRHATGFPSERVMGQGGILDSARLAHWLAKLANVSQQHVRAMVLGGHGDHMVPVRRFASIYGIPATDVLTENAWQTAVEHTRFGGGEILAKFKTHGAAITPAHAVLAMVEALRSQVAHVLPVSVQSHGVYGLPKDVYIGLPAKVSELGVEQILEAPLSADEFDRLHASADSMEKTYQEWKSSQSA
ncbi:malate dehydrogenase [Alicyclobacillus dauci]|uniref:Malate dehydrogenase n=1 Tax=Alicyclobacillus dauci TaxID=1475485 RepID=A0ABY6Z6S3_9BACL|nr:malate dehydrogenase [Alicyclobacillus dauci]WAH38484.1 malate dehydrogenase [Alicyclobacillus dauci]